MSYFLPTFSESERAESCVQQSRPGKINIDHAWYQRNLRRNPLSPFAGWENLYASSRRLRIAEGFPFGLKQDVIDKLVRAGWDDIKRIANVVEALKDNVMFSDPARYPQIANCWQMRKLLRWAVSTEIHAPGASIDGWKSFVTLLRWKACQSDTPAPELPISFPGLPVNPVPTSELQFPRFWERIAPWLYPIWERGIASKFEATRFAHFVTSRNMPAACRSKRTKTLVEHAEVLCSSFPEDREREKLLFDLAFQTGARLKGSLSDAHLSLTNSASIENPISQGGRGREVSEKFRTWISQIPETDVDETTWFGLPYRLRAGIPLWRTMCRSEDASEGRPGDSAPITDVDFTPGKFRYEDPIYCLDFNTGYLMLQWAIEQAIDVGGLVGSYYAESNGLRVGGAPCIRAAAIGEPGNKARVITVGEDWLTLILQPLSHALTGLLRQDPSARAGLSRGWQAFEYTKAWSSKSESDKPSAEERYILSSDLKTATDYCPHGYAKSLLKGYIAGLGKSSPFTEIWIELLVSSRIYRGPVRGHEGDLTSRGILMGDPGSKLVLSLFNKAAEMEAIARYEYRAIRGSTRFVRSLIERHGVPNTRYRMFAFAGDDHVAIGPKAYLKEITKSHARNGMRVAWSSNFISKICGFYCEEILFIGHDNVWQAWGTKKPLKDQLYEDTPHVDALKLRLLSQCAKEHEGKNETNPAIGMASSLRGMVAWFSEGWETTRFLASLRFFQKMGKLLPSNKMLATMPKRLGGLEAPAFHLERTSLTSDWDRLPLLLRKAIVLAMREDCDPGVRRILSTFASNSRARGVDTSSIERQIRETLSSALCECKSLDDLRESLGIDELEWSNLRYWEKAKRVSQLGYLAIGEAIETICRPYTFRDILFPEESIAHGIDPYRRAAFRQLPWHVRLRNAEKAIEESLEDPKIKIDFEGVSDEEILRTRDAIIDSLRKPYLQTIPKDILVVPRSVVVTENLCTLRTPLVR